MVLSKRQKVLIGVCGLALVAFVADRISMGLNPVGPSEASASSSKGSSGGSDAVVELSRGALDSGRTGSAALADRLEALAKARTPGAGGLRDAFCPSQAWVGRKISKDEMPDSNEVRARQFIEAHQLEAVAQGVSGSIAIINSKPLTVGQRLDGFELISVGKNRAVLVSDGARVMLRLADDSAATSGY